MNSPVLLRRLPHRHERPTLMPAVLMDSLPATRSVTPVSRSTAPTARKSPRARRASPASIGSIEISTPAIPEIAKSRFAACLSRCAAAGFRLIVTAPSHSRAFARGLKRFPERRVDLTTHLQWDTAYRVFNGHGLQPHDRGSWRILVVDRDDRVVGAITARFFCGDVVPEYQHLPALLETTGP